MRLSIKGRFAVSAMIDMALREQPEPVSLAAISVRHQIALSYLEQMFSKLRKQCLVESTRGPGGGYCLGRAANAISVADIIDAVESKRPEGSMDQHLQGAPAMPDMRKDLWDALRSKMRDLLQSVMLHTRKRCPRSAPNSVFALA